MKTHTRISLVSLLFQSLLCPLIAQYNPKLAASSLTIGADAVAAAMGSTAIATETNAANFTINPAKINFSQKKFDFAISHAVWMPKLIGNANLFFIGTYLQIKPKHAVGLSLSRFDYGDYNIPDPIYDSIIMGIYNPQDFNVALSYAYKLTPCISLGSTLRLLETFPPPSLYYAAFIKQQEYDIPPRKIVGDIGAFYQTKRKEGHPCSSFSAGIVLANIGSKVDYLYSFQRQDKLFLPTNLGIGASAHILLGNRFFLNPALDIHKLLVPKQRINNSESAFQGIFSGFTTNSYCFSLGNELGTSLSFNERGTSYLKLIARSGYLGDFNYIHNYKMFTVGGGAEVAFLKFVVGGNISYWIPLSRLPINTTIWKVNLGYLW